MDIFEEHVNEYQKAPNESGYDHQLKYNNPGKNQQRRKRNRKRHITGYNPPLKQQPNCKLPKYGARCTCLSG